MKIVLLGSPGAGKGTQCKRIVERYGLEHLSSGDILRRERVENTALGKKAQEYMDSGGLVPDEVVIEMMVKAIKKASSAGYILDGFPRTVVQAERLDRELNQVGEKIDIVLNLEIDNQIVIKRINPGKISAHQTVLKSPKFSCIIRPHVPVFGSPKPRAS